jgi:hypothetical protein
MLLREWHSWWDSIAALEAKEYLALYRVALVADAGWTLERGPILEEWRLAAEGAIVLRARAEQVAARDDARGEVVAMFSWIRAHFQGERVQGVVGEH